MFVTLTVRVTLISRLFLRREIRENFIFYGKTDPSHNLNNSCNSNNALIYI